MRFIPHFVRESITGGIDVSRRALSPSMPLDPALIEFPLQLRSEAARVFFAWTVSLLPGTLSVRLDSTFIMVHVLDQQLPIEAKLRQLEGDIGALFGQSGSS
jgi:multicomponent Na+:H+ antiporter subunit E